ncbi:hypothetical protein EZS27_015565 [termite gut metagenome]|uniref:Phage tail tape measure protein domain-containing protein n=1 Tax=termite gut metagenome TaxID=433724 RepID=A0A5J4RRI9_9ZZZZ
MANTLTYIFSLQDKMSAKLGSITAASDKTIGALGGVKDKVSAADAVFKDTGKSITSLHAKIDALQAEKEWIPAENLTAIKAYNKEIAKLTEEVENLDNAAGGGKFKGWISEIFDTIPGANLLSNPIATGAAALGFAGSQGMKLDESMAQVNITAQLDEKGLGELKEKLKNIAKDNKADIQVAPKGFEAINSQLDDVDLSLSILDASLKGSKAGFTDLDTVSAALAQTLSIVGKENTTAMEVLDTFFAAKRVGASEFADFSQYMPNLIAGASNLGIAYKEVAGTFAYMTGKGQSAERAAVLMTNAFSVLGKGEIRKKMETVGVKIFDDEGKTRGVLDIFTDLQKVMGGLNDEQKSTLLEKLGITDKEAKSAFAVMTSDIDKLRESMNDVTNSAGETDAALDFSANSMQKSTEVWNQLKNIGTEIGELMLPGINAGLSIAGTVLEGVSSVLSFVVGLFGSWFSLLQEGNPVVLGLTAAVGLYTVAMGINYAITQKAVFLAGIKKIADTAQTLATWGLTTAQWALNAAFVASPLGWIALAVGAVVTVVTLCWQKFEGFRVAVLGTWEVIKEFGSTLLDSIVRPFKQVLSGIGGVCSAIVNLVKGNFSEAAAAAKAGFADIGEGVLNVTPAGIVYNTLQNGDYAGAWEKGKQAGHESWEASQKKTGGEDIDALLPTVPVAPQPAGVTNFDDLLKKLGKTKKGTTDKIKLNDNIQNLNETAEYTTVTRKLSPLTVALKPATSAQEKVQSMQADTRITDTPGKVDDKGHNYEGEKETGLLDTMQTVRKIAGAVLPPLAVSLSAGQAKATNFTGESFLPEISVNAPVVNSPKVPAVNIPDVAVNNPKVPTVNIPDVAVNAPNVPAISVPDIDIPTPSDAYSIPEREKVTEKNSFVSENTTTTVKEGKTVHVDRICDNITIHIENTDGKGSETIRAEFMSLLNQVVEG